MKIKRKLSTAISSTPTIPDSTHVVETSTITKCQSGVWDLHRDGITQGLLSGFMLCPEKVRLGSVEGLSQIRTGGALAFGSLVHDVLDQVYSHVMRKKNCNDWSTFTRSVLKIALREKEEADRKIVNEKGGADLEALQMLEENFGMAEGILPGYLEKWQEDFSDVTWVALEQMFDTHVEVNGKTYRIRGKRDGVYRSKKSKQLWLFETKTKGRVDEDSIMDRLTFDLQVMLYLWSMWKDFGEVPGGVVYNIIRKPQLKQKKGESLSQFIDRIKTDTETRPEFYYMRYQSAITESDLVKWETEFMAILSQLVRWYEGEFHYKNSSACSMGGVNCQYLSVCSRNDRSSFRVREIPYPELTIVQ